MAEVEPMIASAIVVPEAIDPAPDMTAQSPPAGPGVSLKRRQSSTSENDSKRPRLSRDGSIESPTPPKVEHDRREARRRNGQVEERKRGQRLFGALLGTLAQRATPSASKRRAVIEQKHKEKLKQQTEEDLQRRQERQEELRVARRRQQVKLDEQNMRLRHSNLVNMAHFLSTTSEPKLYYKPYKLLEEHRVQIKRQIQEVHYLIEDELYDFDRKRREHDTLLEARPASKAEDECMDDAPSIAGELPTVQKKPSQKDLDNEPFVSTLTTDQQNRAMSDTTPKSQAQRNETTQEEPTNSGAEVDTKREEERHSKADQGSKFNAEESKRENDSTTMEHAEYEYKDSRTSAEIEAQAEADMIDEHHGETVVEAEEDTAPVWIYLGSIPVLPTPQYYTPEKRMRTGSTSILRISFSLPQLKKSLKMPLETSNRPTPIDLWSDPRVEHKTASVNGRTYKYLLVMGYGGTDTPEVPPASISLYTFKRASDDIAELARQLGAPNIILGGHDWGGMVVWRCAAWYPELISHLFAICTPYAPPTKSYISTEDLVNGPVPQFGYQLHLASGEVEPRIKDENSIRQFLNGMYGARGPKGEAMFSPDQGILFDNLMKVGKTSLMSDREMDYYVQEYSRNGLHGPLNWYRTRKANWADELKLKKVTIDIPTLFIEAANDSVLKPEMSHGMERHVTQLTRKSVKAAHWAMWERPSEVNDFIREWFSSCVFGREAKL
ncbi:hypothetical protein FKW77_001705 [Venturia effusa]|uniref:AB hydrolase-1 domain-containing protein n=1 Tax=Venturia effusa TaxID=50376 RepID=A0A517LGS6_9PEZI|nr:hypothetical protein FKW77_001705 [Venturia effusa]